MNDVLSKSLTELEGEDWGDASFDSCLASTVHRLRHKPVGEFTIEDLRMTIGQNIGLPVLVPIAIDRLKNDPLAEGDMYPGDLLGSVLRVETDFWLEHLAEANVVQMIVAHALELTNDAYIVAAARQFNGRPT